VFNDDPDAVVFLRGFLFFLGYAILELEMRKHISTMGRVVDLIGV
jgi:hypothetical protein